MCNETKDFNVAEYEKPRLYIVSDYTLQRIFKKLTSVQFGYSLKEECLQFGKAVKILLPFPTAYLFEAKLSLASIKAAFRNQLNEEADLSIQPLL